MARRIPAAVPDRTHVRRFRYPVFSVLSAVVMIVGVQILICVDSGIALDIQAQQDVGFHGAQAHTLDVVEIARARAVSGAGVVRPAMLIRTGDVGIGVDAGGRVGTIGARASARPDIVVGNGDGAEPRGDGSSANDDRAAAKKKNRAPLSRTSWVPADQIGGGDREGAFLGLLLFAVSDPRLRFSH